jgi:hypothetical protein
MTIINLAAEPMSPISLQVLANARAGHRRTDAHTHTHTHTHTHLYGKQYLLNSLLFLYYLLSALISNYSHFWYALNRLIFYRRIHVYLFLMYTLDSVHLIN